MKREIARALGAAAAVALLSFTSLAVAQPRQAGGKTQLQAALHLRPDQVSAFNNWWSAIAPTPEEVATMRSDAQRYGTLRTPARLDLDMQMMNIQQGMARRRAQATRQFYGMLTPDQQHTFDELTAPPPPNSR